MANDRLINSTQGDSIISELQNIADKIKNIGTVMVPAEGHSVIITTIAGATVTLSKTGTTYTSIADANGTATFNAVVAGTYTVRAIYEGATSDSTTVTVTDFSATENTFATISITAADNCIITITDGNTTKTVAYLVGSTITQYASINTTWTISTTIDDTPITKTVNVSSYTNMSVHLKIVTATSVTRQIDFVNNTSSIVDGSVESVTTFTNMKRCNVADDGTINAYDGDAGYTENGTNGQVMVYIPKFWYKLDVSDTGSLDGVNIRKGKWSIADGPLDDFKLHPAFLAADGVTELDYFLYGAFDAVGQDSNGTYSTSYNTTTYKLGSVGGNAYAPTNSLKRATARTMATNRGIGWYSAGVKQTMAIQMLFAVEYGFNSQKTLGWGIVDASTASKTGTTTGSISSGDLSGKTTAVNYRGVENLWGNINNWIDGLNVSDGKPYVCDSYSFADDTSTGYTQISFNIPSSNYISALGYDSNNDWILLPSEASGATENSAIGDYVVSGSGLRVAFLGGRWGYGSYAGAFYWVCDDGSSGAVAGVGARLMYIPQAA